MILMYVQPGEITHDFIHTFLAVKTLCIYLLFVSSFSLSLSLFAISWGISMDDLMLFVILRGISMDDLMIERISTERE